LAGVFPNLPPPPGLPPPPPGLVLPPPPPPLPTTDMIIPQPKVSHEAPVASALQQLSTTTTSSSGLAFAPTMTVTPQSHMAMNQPPPPPPPPPTATKQLKGGLTLVFEPDYEGESETCAEERRASLPRYQKLLLRASITANPTTASA
jgi:hypothetical protein